jgi:hypothetical protein
MKGLLVNGMRVGALLLFVLAAGCAEDAVRPITRNSPPETIAFLPENPDTSLYIQHLSWWGEDTDGEVTHYLFRFLYDAAEWCAPDTAWVSTTATDSVFYLPVTDTLAAHTFEVKAVDDDGAEDPTPYRIHLIVHNSPPSVGFVDVEDLPDTTLTAVTFTWRGTDPVDGDDTILEYLVWLDGADTVYSVAASAFPAGQDIRFGLGRDELRGGADRSRTVHVRAVDSGADSSETVSHTWFVRQPNGRILLIDDAPPALVGSSISDQFYRAVLDSLSGTGEPYTLLDFASHGRFTDEADVFPALEPFELAIWYTSTDSLASTMMDLAESGIRQYLDLGGALILCSMSAMGDGGAFGLDFAAEYAGVGVFHLDIGANVPDTNFDLQRGWYVDPVPGSGLETLRVSRPQIWVEMFSPAAGAESLFRPRAGTYADQDSTWSAATLYEHGAGGRLAYFSFLLERTDALFNAAAQLAKVIDRLLE